MPRKRGGNRGARLKRARIGSGSNTAPSEEDVRLQQKLQAWQARQRSSSKQSSQRRHTSQLPPYTTLERSVDFVLPQLVEGPHAAVVHTQALQHVVAIAPLISNLLLQPWLSQTVTRCNLKLDRPCLHRAGSIKPQSIQSAVSCVRWADLDDIDSSCAPLHTDGMVSTRQQNPSQHMSTLQSRCVL